MPVHIIQGNCLGVLASLPSCSVDLCVTSPPYFGLRDYENADQVGLEENHDLYISKLVTIFKEVWRVLKDDGTLWLNLGDSYSHGGSGARDKVRWPKQSRNAEGAVMHAKRKTGLPPKSLIGIPWRVAFALQADGWLLRQEIIWAKPNPMPESVDDRCTRAHEYIFMFAKKARYYYNSKAIVERALWADSGRRSADKRELKGKTKDQKNPAFRAITETRNKRSVWSVGSKPFPEAHFATFPPELIEPCILAGAPVGGTVLDPFAGAGTVGLVAERKGRNGICIELNPAYCRMMEKRLKADLGFMSKVTKERFQG